METSARDKERRKRQPAKRKWRENLFYTFYFTDYLSIHTVTQSDQQQKQRGRMDSRKEYDREAGRKSRVASGVEGAR